MKKILDWMAIHPILTVLLVVFLGPIVIAMITGQYYFGWYAILCLFVLYMFAPALRRRREKIFAEKEAKENARIRKNEKEDEKIKHLVPPHQIETTTIAGTGTLDDFQKIRETVNDILGEHLPKNEQTISSVSPAYDFLGCYQKKYILTKNEYNEYKKLALIAAERGFLICPKVRLLDLIEPRRDKKNFKTLLYKIQAKHVDFVICDRNLYVKAVLELDDGSHNNSDRIERDKFVDAILMDVGYKVIRTRSITPNTLDGI